MAERPGTARLLPAWWRWVPVWRRNLLVWRKLAFASILGNFGEPLLYLLALGYGLGAFVGHLGGMSYIAFLASGTVCSSAMMTASFEATYSAYTRMRPQRTWEAILASPLEVRDVLLGETAWAASKSLMSATAILVVAVGIGAARARLALLAQPVALITGFSFAAMAMVVTTRARSYESFMYYQTLVLTPTLLLSGVFFPTGRMPAAVRLLGDLLPLSHSVALVRPLLDGTLPAHALAHLAVILAWAIAALLLAVRFARRRLDT